MKPSCGSVGRSIRRGAGAGPQGEPPPGGSAPAGMGPPVDIAASSMQHSRQTQVPEQPRSAARRLASFQSIIGGTPCVRFGRVLFHVKRCRSASRGGGGERGGGPRGGGRGLAKGGGGPRDCGAEGGERRPPPARGGGG